MKKLLKSSLSLFMAVVMLFSVSVTGFSADNSRIIAAANAVNTVINAAFSALCAFFPKNFPTVEEYFANGSENFFEGTENFLDSPAENARWNLGFGEESIVPENLADGSKEYYTGGYFTQKVNSVYDDQCTKAIALNDGSGRGTAVFASIDGVGVSNGDIRAIRAEAMRKLEENGIDADICAININSTHCHTVIDTQGFGLSLIPKVFLNILSVLPFVSPVRSIDEEFLEVMIDGASDAIVEAYMNLESGSLYYFETVGIAKNEEYGIYLDDEYAYLRNKRYGTEGFQNTIACFKFVPDNESSAETVFSNFGAHPTTIDRATEKLSADFPYYIAEKLGESGTNFMFIQGAQSPVSVRKDAVATKEIVDEVNAQIAQDPIVADYYAAKTLGYEFARLITEAEANAVEVDPVLNIRMSECVVPLDTGLLHLGAVSGLLGFTTVKDSESSSGYSLISEVGYIEIGSDIVMLTVPGELIPQLVFGNVVGADEAYLGTDWEIECTADIVGENKTVLVMGLCNDAIGYIIPDNDFAPFIADSLWSLEIGDWQVGKELFGEPKRHYEEMLSAGSKAASSVMGTLNGIVKESN